MLTNPSVETNEALETFLHCCHKRRYPAKKEIVKPGDLGDKLFYVIDGSVSVCMEEPDGREIILAYLNKGDFIGEIGVFMEQDTRGVSVRTRTACQMAEVSYVRLQQALKNELAPYAFDILCMFGKQLSSRLLQTSRKVHHLAFLDVTGRIAGTLIDLCKQPDAITHPDGMQIRITRQEIGRIVGCSREMAGRVLKILQEQGLISARGKTIVVYGTR